MSISYSHLVLPKRKPGPEGESELTARDVGEEDSPFFFFLSFLFFLFLFWWRAWGGEYFPKTKTAFHINE